MSEVLDEKQAAARTGIYAGLTAAITLIVVSAVVWGIMHGVAAYREQAKMDADLAAGEARYHAGQVVSPEFTAKASASAAAIRDLHRTAQQNFKAYSATKPKVVDIVYAMESSAHTSHEMTISDALSGDALSFVNCMDMAAPPTPIYKPSDCESRTPVSTVDADLAK